MNWRSIVVLTAWLAVASGVAELVDQRNVLVEMGVEARRSVETVCFLNPVLR